MWQKLDWYVSTRLKPVFTVTHCYTMLGYWSWFCLVQVVSVLSIKLNISNNKLSIINMYVLVFNCIIYVISHSLHYRVMVYQISWFIWLIYLWECAIILHWLPGFIGLWDYLMMIIFYDSLITVFLSNMCLEHKQIKVSFINF